ncbi:hypothetical protein [Fluviicola taffensis]|uniref:Uncharacterized protein n=1 Tax=Fluviicola taffensis (strain DSM 16823 / NCIMB 13979 / RW262) TaxID=755732 RepID=F2IBL7_FLUTR|nr:hypothetical protein [Fluviicola taffensis]AEA45343.1 hypothetical protein Fluta_3371 [Fluviicola taffensis DSM 16823]
MKDNDLQLDVQRRLNDGTSKFIYYIIALAVAAIGFAVNKSFGKKPEGSDFWLMGAVILWSLCIYSGFRFNIHTFTQLSTSNAQYDLVKEYNLLENSEDLKFVNDKYSEILNGISKKIDRAFNDCIFTFFSGVIFFAVWHILMMFNSPVSAPDIHPNVKKVQEIHIQHHPDILSPDTVK